MKIIPTEKLLGAVFGDQKVRDIQMVSPYSPTEIEYKVAEDSFASYKTIYELQYLIKEWAQKNGYIFLSNHFICYVYKDELGLLEYDEVFKSTTEYNSVVLAGEWLVNQL